MLCRRPWAMQKPYVALLVCKLTVSKRWVLSCSGFETQTCILQTVLLDHFYNCHNGRAYQNSTSLITSSLTTKPSGSCWNWAARLWKSFLRFKFPNYWETKSPAPLQTRALRAAGCALGSCASVRPRGRGSRRAACLRPSGSSSAGHAELRGAFWEQCGPCAAFPRKWHLGWSVRCQKGSPSCLTYIPTVLNVELEEIKRFFASYEKSREGLKLGMVGCVGISTWHIITSWTCCIWFLKPMFLQKDFPQVSWESADQGLRERFCFTKTLHLL